MKDFRRPTSLFKKFEDEIKNNPQTEHEKKLGDKLRASDLEERPLVADLARVGILVDSIDDLTAAGANYDEAIPVLAHHLGLNYSNGIQGMVARSLGIPAAYPYWDVIKKAYLESDVTTHPGGQDGLGLALAYSSGDKRLPEIMELAELSDKWMGRGYLIGHLQKYYRRPEVWKWLEDHEHDPTLKVYNLSAWLQKRREKMAEAATKKPATKKSKASE